MAATALTTELLLDLLTRERFLTADQKRTVQVKESAQRSRILTAKASGQRRDEQRYEVSPTEVIASFGWNLPGRPGEKLDEDRIAEVLADRKSVV